MTAHKPNRQDEILDAAADLFAVRPFHEVRLDDIAARAHIGKGTVYLYWSSKEDVYLAVIRRGFAAVLSRVEAELPSQTGKPLDQLTAIIRALVDFAFAFPAVYRLMRGGTLTPEDPDLQNVRRKLVERIQSVIESGVCTGEFCDPCPALTAQYIMSFIRGALLYPPADLTRESLSSHMLHMLRRGIAKEASPC
jgi:AcrR family transcriptional regulator